MRDGGHLHPCNPRLASFSLDLNLPHSLLFGLGSFRGWSLPLLFNPMPSQWRKQQRMEMLGTCAFQLGKCPFLPDHPFSSPRIALKGEIIGPFERRHTNEANSLLTGIIGLKSSRVQQALLKRVEVQFATINRRLAHDLNHTKNLLPCGNR